MRHLRNIHKSFAAFLLLLIFGMQVQATFACEVADYSGPIEDCCCGDGHDQALDAATGMADDKACCSHDLNLVVKGSDPEQDNAPAVAATAVELKLSPPLLTFFLIWLDEPVPPTKSSPGDAAAPPLTPGNRTYLTTQRLRI